MTSANASKLRSELAQQGGVLGSLVELADQIREAATTVASFVESVALEIDRERRGPLAAIARQDAVELAATILSLTRDPLLAPEARAALAARLLRELRATKPRPRTPPQPARSPNRPQARAARRS